MEKSNFLASVLVSIFLIIAFVYSDKFSLSSSKTSWLIFFTIFIVGMIGSMLFKKYKDSKVSTPIVLITYSTFLIIILMIF